MIKLSQGFIDNAFQETSIAELVFLNTVYFNGTWNFNVKSESVSKMVFHRAYSEPIVVEALHVTEVSAGKDKKGKDRKE